MGRRYGFGGPRVLRGVDLALPPRGLIRVEAPTAAASRPCCGLLAGIDPPTEGRVIGRPGRTAYVPERFPVALPFTAAG